MSNKEIFEVSPMELIKYLLKKIWIVALVTLIFASLGFLKFEKTNKREYESTATLLIVPNQNIRDNNYDYQIVNESVVIINGNTFAKSIHAKDKSLTTKEVMKSLDVTKEDNAKVIHIQVLMPSQEKSKKVLKYAIEEYTDLMTKRYHAENIDVLNLKYKKTNKPTNNKKTFIKYTGLGFVIGILIVIILFIIGKMRK
ncbi:Wzz/FepE/Etk N-terminal domain-containing protein [Sharpea porci]|uniref:Wzz/FepE/Etk N-terminal domain-containing protein n=1 Tax=Sharpea porci TaxID=2652286 RepID=UPI002A90973C|nr:Wzz/FepE/Etk N-terminal domain-containing protein [Sharpea porci]MDY5279823.1 Wzz/FepE/Etk N-terminal domain-containing protein [Sharpea porci]